jgi:cobalt-zinc-cadmium efflux system outer membrane protein
MRAKKLTTRRRARAGRRAIALLLCALSVAGARAADEAASHAGPWTLEALVDELTRNNAQLEQARQGYAAAKLQVPQARALLPAQVSVTEQANTGGPFDFNPSSGFYAYPTVTQPLQWPGKRGLAGDVASAQAEVVGRQYDALVVQLVAQLKLDFYQLSALQQQLHFLDEDGQRLEEIKEVARVRYANNAAAYVDFLNAQVSASQLANQRFALQKQIQSSVEQLNVLLGHPSQTPLEIGAVSYSPHLPPQSLQQLIVLAQQSNPTIAGGQSQIDAATKSLALAQKSFFPDFSVSVGAYTDPSLLRPDHTHMYAVGVTVNLPTWGFEKEKAAVGQARATLNQARAGQDSNQQQVELNVANAYHGLETSLQQVEFVRDRQLPQAQMAYRLALNGYSSNGGTDFSALLTAQSSLRDTELSLIEAQNGAVQAYVNLATAIGRDPE